MKSEKKENVGQLMGWTTKPNGEDPDLTRATKPNQGKW